MIAGKTLIVEEHVTLPTDATGSTIHRGDMVLAKDGKTWRVRTLMLGEDGWLLDCQPEDGEPPAGRTVRPELCIATHQRTVEDVLLDMAVNWECAADGEDKAEVLKEYADEIRQMLDD